MQAWRRLIDALRLLESGITAIAYVVVAALLVGDVVAREVLGQSIWGAQKMAVLATVFAGFCGFAMVTHANAHLRIGLADAIVPKRFAAVHERAGDLLSAALLTGFAVIAAMFVRDAFNAGEQVEVLYIPTWPFQLVFVYAFASSALRHLAFALYPALKPAPEGEGSH
jgi:TRAP-type C4-dicarboxylate transport system permease small subunit